jgi:hypothetical protein
MKTLLISALLAAAIAFVFAPISFEVATSILLALGLGSILTLDYARRTSVLQTRTTALASCEQRRSTLRLAA